MKSLVVATMLLFAPITWANEQGEVVQISAGANHTCAVFKSGRAACWGDNSLGQLGRGHQQQSIQIELVQLKEKIVQIHAGMSFTCAVFESGKAKCWGANALKQLGFESSGIAFFDMDRLRNINISEKIKTLSLGDFRACAVLVNGKAKCWGSNYLNLLGAEEPGDLSSWFYSLIATPSPPRQVLIDGNIISLSIGFFHNCVLLESGQAKCWGSNILGGLGNGQADKNAGETVEAMRNLEPVLVDEKIIQLTTSCALFDSGKAKCWGSNATAQLGIGREGGQFISANELQGLPYVALNERIKHIESTEYRACAILESDRLRCWGDNSKNAVGVGQIQFAVGSTPDELNMPIAAVGDEKVKQVTLGKNHTCALLFTGRVRCWGTNTHGELGTGDTLDRGAADYGDNSFPDVVFP